jgi:hypothetical protein
MGRPLLDKDKELEKQYLTTKRSLIYIACEDLDFVWDEHDLIEFVNDWKSGKSIYELSSKFEREQDEVAILIMDLARKGMIHKRAGGIFGTSHGG